MKPIKPLPPPNLFIREGQCRIDQSKVSLADYRALEEHERQALQEARTRIAALEEENRQLLAVLDANLHQRRCRDCGHVGWHKDAVVPYCLCARCGSQDTRRVRREVPHAE